MSGKTSTVRDNSQRRMCGMDAAERTLIYLYCITNGAPVLKPVAGMMDGPYLVRHQGVYAVCSNVSEGEFGKENLEGNLGDLEWVKAMANIHEKIVEQVTKYACVIPLKFGALFTSEGSLKAMLEKHAEGFLGKLEHLEGKEEWGVKIYCDLERVKDCIVGKDPDILRMDREIVSSPVGKAFFLKKKREGVLNTIAKERINEYSQDSFEALSKLSADRRINRLLPKEVTEKKDEMILNSAFLVEKDKVAGFITTADVLRIQHEDNGLSFDCTGPWPPYNFCSFSDGKAIE